MKKGLKVLSLFDGLSGCRQALKNLDIEVESYDAFEIDTYAIKIAQKNHPDINQHGSVVGADFTKFAGYDLLVAGSPCFVAGTTVICKNEIKNIEDVNVGDLVLTHTGKYQKVLRIGNKVVDKTVLLKTQGFLDIETTEEHPFYTRIMNRKWNNVRRTSERVFSDPQWLEVKDIQKDYFLGKHIIPDEENILNLTEDECYILGRYIADGHTIKQYRKEIGREKDRMWGVILSIGKHKIQQIYDNIKNTKYTVRDHTQSVYQICFYSKHLTLLTEEHCGIGSLNKNFSKTLLNLPKNLLEIVVKGFMDGDGSLHKSGDYGATTISKKLISTLSLAILKIYGTNSNITFTKRPPTTVIEGRTVNQRDTYTLRFRKNNNKQDKSILIDDIMWSRFKEKIRLNGNKVVYNLEVEEDNSYTANNIIVHNCQGFSFCGKQLAFEDPRSKLFFEFVRALNEVKPKYFLLENVKMKKEYSDKIDELVGVKHIIIDSAKLSGQTRKRLYWTNIPNVTQPNDLGILLRDIVHENDESPVKITDRNIKHFKDLNRKSLTCTATMYKGAGNNGMTLIQEYLQEYIVPFIETFVLLEKEVQTGKMGYFRKDSQANRVYYLNNKAITLCGASGGGAAKMGQYFFGDLKIDLSGDRKIFTLDNKDGKGILKMGYIRKLTVQECEILQTLPIGYTTCDGISNTQRYKMIGNGFTVKVIEHILSFMK